MPAKVAATVSGIAVATTSAERQSIRNSATSTTITTASKKARRKSRTRWSTDTGWFEIVTMSSPAGSRARNFCSTACAAFPAPFAMCT